MTKSSDASDSAPVILRLGAAEADLATGTLRHPDGTETLLRPKSADVLRVLAARRGEVVTKQALMDAVWGDVSVTEDGLVQCVGDIRRGLSDDDHRLVRTVPRQGYMLAADAPAPGRRPRAPGRRAVALVSGVVALCALLVIAAVAMPWRQAPSDDRPTIAVLPFENLTDDPRWTRLGRGLSTDIASALAHHRQISVIGAETSHAARDADPVAAGRRIGAHFLLLGDIRPVADGLRIDARMIDAETGRLEWSESWTRDAEDLFAIQNEIVARSASGLWRNSGSARSTRRWPARRAQNRPAACRPTRRICWGSKTSCGKGRITKRPSKLSIARSRSTRPLARRGQ